MKHFILLFSVLLSMSLGAQQLTHVSPNNNSSGSTPYVSITGQNTTFTQGSNTVWFRMGTQTYFNMPNPVAVDNTHLVGQVPIPHNVPQGNYDVVVHSAAHGVMSLPGAFHVFSSAPHITTVTPNQAQQGQNLTVNVSTQNAHFGTGSVTQVYFSQGSYTIMGTNTQVLGTNEVETDVVVPPSAPTGLYHTFAYNPYDGTMNKLNSFTVNQGTPIYDSTITVSPNVALVGSEINVYVDNGAYMYSILQPLVSCFLVKGNQMLPVTKDTNFINAMGFFGTIDLPYDPYVNCYDVVVHDYQGTVYHIPCAIEVVSNSEPRIDSIIPDRLNGKVDVYGSHTNFSYSGLNVELYMGMGYIVVKSPKNVFQVFYDSLNVIDDGHMQIYSSNFFNNTKSLFLAPVWVEIVDNASNEELTYPFLVDSPGNITTRQVSQNVRSFPNPTKGMVTLEIEDRNEDVEVHVYSMTGRLLKKEEYQMMERIDVDMAAYPKGSYLIYVKGQRIKGSTVVIKSE